VIVVAIDPGRDAGLAVLVDGRLVAARLLDGRAPDAGLDDLGLLAGEVEVLVELPTYYPHGRSPAPANDLIRLAYRAGRLAQAVLAALGPRTVKVVEIAPATWKAQVPVEVLETRILGRLEPDERALALEAAGRQQSKTHNVLDAVGMGLHRVGRMGRGGT
jgi:hypothetical protein